jgi:hypothetical protein
VDNPLIMTTESRVSKARISVIAWRWDQ